jgi:hypothetical protein
MTASISPGQEDKSRLSPEVYACAWLDIGRACEMSMTSNCEAFVPCNEWQREQFDLHGVVRRDPMFQTMSTLMELEKYPRHVPIPWGAESTLEKYKACGAGLASTEP